MLRYIELKTGYNDDGPAWVGRITLSRSRRTVYFNGRALKQAGRGRYIDLITREEFWVSGVKRNGEDRHRAGSGVISIEASAVAEYLQTVQQDKLDDRRFKVIADLPATDPAGFTSYENLKLRPELRRD